MYSIRSLDLEFWIAEARHHATMAKDQASSFSDPDDARQSYRENFVDTMADEGVKSGSLVDLALEAFDSEARKLFGE